MAVNQCPDGVFVGRNYFARHGIAQYLWVSAMGLWASAMVLFLGSFVAAQPPANPSLGLVSQPGNRPSQGIGSGQPTWPGPGAAGGSAQADFDSLINLIQSTVAPDSWLENGTGEGDIQPFPTGVLVDAAGTLRLSANHLPATGQASAALVRGRRQWSSPADVPAHARTASKLRFVSLPRLEQAIAWKQQQHHPVTIDMLTLAGLQRIEYVLVSSPTEGSQVGDLALAITLIDTEGLSERAGWQPGLLLDFQRLRLPAVATPGHVETVINHRVLKGRHILAGVSGGVWVDAEKTLRVREVEQANERALSRSRAKAPAGTEDTTWWWD
jgi:hypothetical protein